MLFFTTPNVAPCPEGVVDGTEDRGAKIYRNVPEPLGTTAIATEAMECLIIAHRRGAPQKITRSFFEYPLNKRTAWLIPLADPAALAKDFRGENHLQSVCALAFRTERGGSVVLHLFRCLRCSARPRAYLMKHWRYTSH